MLTNILFTMLLAELPFQTGFQLRTDPTVLRIEQRQDGIELSLDFIISVSSGSFKVTEIKVELWDSNHAMFDNVVLSDDNLYPWLKIWNGNAVIPETNDIPENGKAIISNPLHHYTDNPDLDSILFTVKVEWDNRNGKLIQGARVKYLEDAVKLFIPVRGAWLVTQSHESGEFHREQYPVSNNFNSYRYGYDLAKSDFEGSIFRNDGMLNSDYHGWNQPVIAPIGLTVDAAVDEYPDHGPDQAELDNGLGNYYIVHYTCPVDLYIIYGNLKHGSLRYRAGQTIAFGDTMAMVGNSGDANNPQLHIHYQYNDKRINFGAGLPATLSTVEKLNGDLWIPYDGVCPVNGDIIRNTLDIMSLPKRTNLQLFINRQAEGISFEISPNESALLKIYSLNGSLLHHQQFAPNNNQYLWSPKFLADNVYFVRLSNQEETINRKVVYLR